MKTVSRRQKNDIRLVGKFIEVYCEAKHSGDSRSLVTMPSGLASRSLCKNCRSFLEYAIAKRLKCPLEEEKPTCKRCRIHCYDKPNREKIREVMAFSGRKLIMKGRLDYLWHYLF